MNSFRAVCIAHILTSKNQMRNKTQSRNALLTDQRDWCNLKIAGRTGPHIVLPTGPTLIVFD